MDALRAFPPLRRRRGDAFRMPFGAAWRSARNETEQESIGGQQNGVLPNRIGALRSENAG